MKRNFLFYFFVLFAFTKLEVFAIDKPAVKVIENMLANLVKISDSKKIELEKKKDLSNLFYSQIDWDYMAKMSIGKYFKEMNDSQQIRYLALYKKFVMYTRMEAFRITSGDQMKIDIKKDPIVLNETDQEVSTLVKVMDGNNYDLKFTLRSKNNKDFLVLNIIWDGVNIILSYREQFYSSIEETGLETFLKKLNERVLSLEKTRNGTQRS